MPERVRRSSAIAATSNYDVNVTSRTYAPTYRQTGVYHSSNDSVCYDGLHPGIFSRFADTSDIGGPFDLTSNVYESIHPALVNYEAGGFWDAYAHGLFWPSGSFGGTWSNSEQLLESSPNQILAKGATAISRCLPTNPAFGLSRAIGELRNDGLPAIVGMKTLKEHSKYLKNSGNEYLNVQFGWLPLISDLLGMARAVKSANKIVEQYRKASDSKIRRRYNYPVNVVSKSGVTDNIEMVPISPFSGIPWRGAQSIKVEEKTWFSGSFRYHIPLGDDFASKVVLWESEANKLLGLRLTPKVVFDLAPWTWATGWFSNFGDVLKNVSSLGPDGLVLQHGYVMNSHVTRIETSAWTDRPDQLYNADTTRVYKHLRRFAATPYGFGFDMGLLTPTQDAILVALGLSHGLR